VRGVAFGRSDEDAAIAAYSGKSLDELETRSDDFQVLEENWDACNLFMDCSGQWKFVHGERVALDYNAVDVVMRRKKYPDSVSLFEQLQVIESTALNELRKK